LEPAFALRPRPLHYRWARTEFPGGVKLDHYFAKLLGNQQRRGERHERSPFGRPGFCVVSVPPKALYRGILWSKRLQNFIGTLALSALVFCPSVMAQEQNGWQLDSLQANSSVSKSDAQPVRRSTSFSRDRTFENQRYRASGLNLTIAAITLWNTVYLSRAVAELRAQGEFLPDTLLAHIRPLGWEHISFNGDYVWPSEPFKDGFGRCEIPASRSSMLLSVRLEQILR
jgi:hypothetical protein